jgi:hypothetical protein
VGVGKKMSEPGSDDDAPPPPLMNNSDLMTPGGHNRPLVRVRLPHCCAPAPPPHRPRTAPAPPPHRPRTAPAPPLHRRTNCPHHRAPPPQQSEQSERSRRPSLCRSLCRSL